MKKQYTYNAEAQKLHARFNEQTHTKMLELLDEFINEHPDPEIIDGFDDLANALMLAGLHMKTRIKTNPISRGFKSRRSGLPEVSKRKEIIKFRD